MGFLFVRCKERALTSRSFELLLGAKVPEGEELDLRGMNGLNILTCSGRIARVLTHFEEFLSEHVKSSNHCKLPIEMTVSEIRIVMHLCCREKVCSKLIGRRPPSDRTSPSSTA